MNPIRVEQKHAWRMVLRCSQQGKESSQVFTPRRRPSRSGPCRCAVFRRADCACSYHADPHAVWAPPAKEDSQNQPAAKVALLGGLQFLRQVQALLACLPHGSSDLALLSFRRQYTILTLLVLQSTVVLLRWAEGLSMTCRLKLESHALLPIVTGLTPGHPGRFYHGLGPSLL